MVVVAESTANLESWGQQLEGCRHTLSADLRERGCERVSTGLWTNSVAAWWTFPVDHLPHVGGQQMQGIRLLNEQEEESDSALAELVSLLKQAWPAGASRLLRKSLAATMIFTAIDGPD